MDEPQPAKRGGAVRSFLLMFAAAVGMGIIAGLIAGYFARSNRPTPERGPQGETSLLEPAPHEDDDEENPYASFRVADFHLIDQDGLSVDQSLLDGRVTVLTFFFTSCNGPCPEIAKVMRDIQDRTAELGPKSLRLLSISVDGGRDTPAVIRSFGESYGADPTRWRFLTGGPDLVRELVKNSLGFDVREQADVQVSAPDGTAMNNILHPTRLMLVGPDRRLIGLYWYTDPAQVDKLIEEAREALG
ncbi:MAG: SCO family protein [Phycisphaeraceae bacterium]|nr:MAG: SCO family protein [Phycisphaeraceae bacterium]